MITVKPKQNSALSLYLSTTGLVVFLDAWAISGLAKGDPTRRKRFVTAMHRGADLLFSVSNAAELSGPQERSFNVIRGFLEELGPRWFPVELDPLLEERREGSPRISAAFQSSLWGTMSGR